MLPGTYFHIYIILYISINYRLCALGWQVQRNNGKSAYYISIFRFYLQSGVRNFARILNILVDRRSRRTLSSERLAPWPRARRALLSSFARWSQKTIFIRETRRKTRACAATVQVYSCNSTIYTWSGIRYVWWVVMFVHRWC